MRCPGCSLEREISSFKVGSNPKFASIYKYFFISWSFLERIVSVPLQNKNIFEISEKSIKWDYCSPFRYHSNHYLNIFSCLTKTCLELIPSDDILMESFVYSRHIIRAQRFPSLSHQHFLIGSTDPRTLENCWGNGYTEVQGKLWNIL